MGKGHFITGAHCLFVCFFMFSERTNQQAHTHTNSHTNTQSSQFLVRLCKNIQKEKSTSLHACSFPLQQGQEGVWGMGGGKSCLTISIWVAESVAPQPSQQYIPLHRFLCCGMKWGHFPCRLLKAEWQQASDVEDPRRSALKDSRRVWREFGPHQMFLQDR